MSPENTIQLEERSNESRTISDGEIMINLQRKHLNSIKDPLVLELAIKAKDCKLIEHLLEINYNVNITSNYCEPVLNCAINCNNYNLVKKLIPKVDINARTKDGTALALAIALEYYDIANLLISAGANVKDHKKTNYNLINEAVDSGKYEMVKCLISLGYNLNNICPKTEETPLQIAARKNSKELVEILINNNADVNSELQCSLASFINRIFGNRNFTSPLHYAVVNKNKEIVYMLLKKGANIGIKSELLGSVVDKARSMNFIEFLEILSVINIDKNSSSDCDKEVHWAVDECEFDLARKLIDRILIKLQGNSQIKKRIQLFKYLFVKGVNAEIFSQNEPLIQIACKKWEEIIQYLIYGIPTDYSSAFCNVTFLLSALFNNHVELAKYLIDKYGEVNEAWCDVKPLQVAIINNRVEIAKYLIDKGANLNCLWRDITPLHLGILFGRNEIAEYIIEKGADLNAVWRGTTLLNLAIFYARNRIAKDLIDKNANLNVISHGISSLRLAMCKKNEEIAEYLIENGANLDEICQENISSNLDVEFQQNEVVKFLLRYSCYSCIKINDLESKKKTTLLHLALKSDDENFINCLLNAGFDVNKEDSDGKVAINYTIEYLEEYHRLDCVELIEEHVIKLLAAEFYVSDKNKNFSRDYDSLYYECLEEVKILKEGSLTSTLTFYDLLHRPINESTRKLRIWFKNSRNDEQVDFNYIKLVFPLYRGIINFRLKKVLKRAELMVKLNKFVCYLSCNLYLEANLVRDIFEYLSNVELKVIYNNL
ncbi:ankyrin-3-like [Cotesia glomerata]|uniref:ankyrin-3-like n=1 Tax=Cotesia glomerata TaxID=32391 RepID=UPI001D00DA38|nr:ankyrin-3-like [Cotesia glomerata]